MQLWDLKIRRNFFPSFFLLKCKRTAKFLGRALIELQAACCCPETAIVKICRQDKWQNYFRVHLEFCFYYSIRSLLLQRKWTRPECHIFVDTTFLLSLLTSSCLSSASIRSIKVNSYLFINGNMGTNYMILMSVNIFWNS